MHYSHTLSSNIACGKQFTRDIRSINLVIIKYLELKVQISEHLSVTLFYYKNQNACNVRKRHHFVFLTTKLNKNKK